MSEKLLIVEDDKKLNDGIRLALKNDAYFFYQCRTLQEAREILKKEDITLVLLDVNLPDGNGIDFVREIRKNSQVSIILLTVNNMEVDIVTGLEAGANDYITKPFSLMVLRARAPATIIQTELCPDYGQCTTHTLPFHCRFHLQFQYFDHPSKL